MGANLLVVVATVALQSPQQDTVIKAFPATRQAVERPRTRGSIPVDPEPVAHGFGFERLPDVLQYNRVQGLSIGLGYRVPLPGIPLTGLYGTVRYGFSDERVTGRISVLREVPGSRVALSGYYDLADLDPFSPGRSFSNTFNGLFAGHDNGDYAIVGGGSVRVERAAGPSLRVVVTARVERENSVRRVAESEVNDLLGGTGLFPANPPVKEGTFGGAALRLSRVGALRWNLTADGLRGAGYTTGRLFGDVRWALAARPGLTLRVKAGAATEPTPSQSLFRLGGVNTVRGFEYGTRRGPTIWAAQLDLAPLGGRIRPVVFVDAGQVAALSDLFSSTALVGGGAGLSLLRGLLRLDVSRPVTPDLGGKLRFDLVIKAVR